MKRTIKHIAPWLAAAAIGGALVFAPVASADSSADPGPSRSQSQGGAGPERRRSSRAIRHPFRLRIALQRRRLGPSASRRGVIVRPVGPS
jgi:hypothetical protein